MLRKFLKGLENTKPMLSLKKHIILSTMIATLAFSAKAGAGLYGFTETHPYTQEESILDMGVPPKYIVNYRDAMRANVLMLMEYAKKHHPNFQFIAHEGQPLLSQSLWEQHLSGYNNARNFEINASDPSFLLTDKDRDKPVEPTIGSLARRYISNMNAVAINNFYCGAQTIQEDFLKKHNITIISLENCPDENTFDQAVIRSVFDKRLFYGFDNPQYAFNDITHQPLINETAKNVTNVKDAKNILLLIDDNKFAQKFDLIKALRNTNYDIVIINPLFHGQERYTPQEVRSLQFKKNGTRRLLIAEMNMSEAQDSAYYWHPEWRIGQPTWLNRISFVNDDSVITSYWSPEWQKIISNHFKGIVDSSFDGVFLTGLDNYRYFEKLTPLE